MAPVPTPRNAATQTPPDQQDRQREARAAAAKPPKVTQPVNPLGPQLPGYTPDQSNLIWAQVQAAQLPANQKINNAQATADATSMGARQDISDYYGALGPLLNKIAPSVQQGYTQAAGLDAVLGKGFGNAFSAGDAAQNAQNAGYMNRTGGTMAPVDNSPVGNAIGWLGGGLPAQGLNTTGAAANAEARMMPGQIGALGGEQVGLLARDQLAQDQQFNQQRADLAGQIPGLVLKFGAQAVENALKQSNAAAAQQYKQALLTGYYLGEDGKMHPTAATIKSQQANSFKEAALTGTYVGADGKTYQTVAGKTAESLAAAREAAMTGQYLGADGKVYPTLAAQTAANNAALRARGLDISQQNANIAQGNLNLATTKSKNAITKYNNSIIPTLNSARSNYNHYATDQFGHPLLDAKHQLVPQVGYKLRPDGQGVVKDPKAANTSAQKMTSSNVKNVASQLHTWKLGIVGTAQGRPTTDTAAALTYTQALQRAQSLLPNTSEGFKKATQLTNIEYGTPLKIALGNVRGDIGDNMTIDASIQNFVAAAQATGSPPYPIQAQIQALASLYGYSPVVVAEKMDAAMRNTQVTGG